jgi:hypothetical protein
MLASPHLVSGSACPVYWKVNPLTPDDWDKLKEEKVFQTEDRAIADPIDFSTLPQTADVLNFFLEVAAYFLPLHELPPPDRACLAK